MAKAVVTLEGDSSSLVDSIDKAKGAMTKLEAGGRKLTDQLRDVADEADKAAGALVNKIGGPTAIKAMAGVGAAFVGAQAALGAFSSSMAAYAATQGAAGQKAMADLDTALNELQGQLFTAVMGTDDMAEAMDTVITVVKAATLAVEALLSPIKGVSTLVRALGQDMDGLSGYVIEASDSLDTLASKTRADGLSKNAEGIEGLRIRLMGLKNETAELFQLEMKRDIGKANSLKQDILANELQVDAIASAAAVVGAKGELEKKANAARQAYIRDLGEEKLSLAQQAEARRIYSAEYTAQGQLIMAQQMEQRKGVSAANQAQLDEVNGQIAEFQKLAATGPITPAKTGGGGGRGETAAAKAKREAAEAAAAAAVALEARVAMFGQATDAEIAAYKAAAETKTAIAREQFNAARALAIETADLTFNLTQTPEQYIAEEEKKAEAAKAKVAADIALRKAEYDARVAMFGQASIAEIDAYNATKEAKAAADQAEFDAARQRAIELHDLTFNLNQTAADFAAGERAKEKAAHEEKVSSMTAGFQEYGKLAGQQLANGEKASKIAEKLAKKAIGGQISALGDQAMIKAAAYAAELNPLAFPMAAAGVAAYSAAAYLGAEGKKATSGTPAAAAPAAAPVNTSFNLRVDAAFADGESIARQFASLQKSAQRRGLVPVGA